LKTGPGRRDIKHNMTKKKSSYKRGRYLKYLPLLITIVIPGSGYVFLGRPMRGLVMLFWMIIFGYLTFMISSPEISFIGRISGGLAVWMLSVIEVYRAVSPSSQNSN